jgi:hypothetical protein
MMSLFSWRGSRWRLLEAPVLVGMAIDSFSSVGNFSVNLTTQT